MSFGVWHWQTTLYLGMIIGDWVRRGLPGDLAGKAWLSRCGKGLCKGRMPITSPSDSPAFGSGSLGRME